MSVQINKDFYLSFGFHQVIDVEIWNIGRTIQIWYVRRSTCAQRKTFLSIDLFSCLKEISVLLHNNFYDCVCLFLCVCVGLFLCVCVCVCVILWDILWLTFPFPSFEFFSFLACSSLSFSFLWHLTKELTYIQICYPSRWWWRMDVPWSQPRLHDPASWWNRKPN